MREERMLTKKMLVGFSVIKRGSGSTQYTAAFWNDGYQNDVCRKNAGPVLSDSLTMLNEKSKQGKP